MIDFDIELVDLKKFNLFDKLRSDKFNWDVIFY